MTNLDFIQDLIDLNDTCLRSGMVKVQRYESCTQIQIPRKGVKDFYKHYFKIVPISIRKVCWTTPYRCKKNIEILQEIMKKYSEYFYLAIEPYYFGKKVRIKCYDVFGRKRKVFRIKCFSINLGIESVNQFKKNNKKKGK